MSAHAAREKAILEAVVIIVLYVLVFALTVFSHP